MAGSFLYSDKMTNTDEQGFRDPISKFLKNFDQDLLIRIRDAFGVLVEDEDEDVKTDSSDISDQTPIILDEASRVYTFPNGQKVRIEHPRELIVRPSGTHRIKDDIGNLHVINAGWLAIEIDNKGSDWNV